MVATNDKETSQSGDLDHFLRLAMRGRHRGASSGEKQAYNMAKAIIENCQGVDDTAIAGLIKFTAKVSTWEGRELAREMLGLD